MINNIMHDYLAVHCVPVSHMYNTTGYVVVVHQAWMLEPLLIAIGVEAELS